MSLGAIPCISIAIDRLTATGSANFAIWVIQSPLPGGYVHRDCVWSEALTQKWLVWQEMFSLQNQPHIPVAAPDRKHLGEINLPSYGRGYGERLMQDLGISLWQWLFDGTIRDSLAQSQGIAIGQNKPLRLRLEIRDPNLIPLPWEIMQPAAGKQAISLNQKLLFSRTTTDVDPLSNYFARDTLNILLVLGEGTKQTASVKGDLGKQSILGNESLETLPDLRIYPEKTLELEREAATLARLMEQSARVPGDINRSAFAVPIRVDCLLQPTPEKLIESLETGLYNVIFYAGHGISAPDGGLLFLRPNATINGTELAQVLVRNQISLAVFNACWGAQSARQGQQAIERSSLAEVLIHHGVPAVLAMRDSIADGEALTFIEAFTRAICARMPIDRAVAVARQKLLTLYKFNQPAWTLPILYMHPEFDGELLKPIHDAVTELPMMPASASNKSIPVAYISSVEDKQKVWQFHGTILRVGRGKENDLVIEERWVSQKHAEIICREIPVESKFQYRYFLRDFSRFGTLVYAQGKWRKVHHQEVPLQSGLQLKFGSIYGQTLEFSIK